MKSFDPQAKYNDGVIRSVQIELSVEIDGKLVTLQFQNVELGSLEGYLTYPDGSVHHSSIMFSGRSMHTVINDFDFVSPESPTT